METSKKQFSKTSVEMDLDCTIGQKMIFKLEIGRMAERIPMESRFTQMAIGTKATSKTTTTMVTESSKNRPINNSMKDFGKTNIPMVKASLFSRLQMADKWKCLLSSTKIKMQTPLGVHSKHPPSSKMDKMERMNS